MSHTKAFGVLCLFLWGCAPQAKPASDTTTVSYATEGKELAKQGKITEAVTLFNRGIAAKPQDEEAYIGLAVLYESVNRPDLAIETLEQLQSANPNAPSLMVRLAEAYLGADDLTTAKNYGEKAVQAGVDAARAHSVYGITMVRFRYWDTAETHLRKAWELSPNEIDIPIVLMEAAIQKGDYAKATEVGEQVLPKSKPSAPLHYKMGWAYARQPLRKDVTDRALQHLQKAAELSPEWFEPHAEMGRLYLSLNRRDEALQGFEAAWKRNGQTAGVAFNLANLLRAKGDPRSKEIEAKYNALMKNKERFTALRREYNSPTGKQQVEQVIALAASERKSRLYGTALHRLRKLLKENVDSVPALQLYIETDTEARNGYPNYLRPGPGIMPPRS